jgi:hypothetical protein
MDVLEAYAALELVPGTSMDEVRQAFRRLSKRYHPDKHTDDNRDWASESFRHVRAAYDFLVRLAEAEARQDRQARVQRLRRLVVSKEGVLQESVLIAVHEGLCVDVGAWGRQPPFYSRLSLKLGAAVPRLELDVLRSDDFENATLLRSARSLGRLKLSEPLTALTILTKIDAGGRVKISLLGEHRFLNFEWHEPEAEAR